VGLLGEAGGDVGEGAVAVVEEQPAGVGGVEGRVVRVLARLVDLPVVAEEQIEVPSPSRSPQELPMVRRASVGRPADVDTSISAPSSFRRRVLGWL